MLFHLSWPAVLITANRQTSSDKVRNDTRLGPKLKANPVGFFSPPFHTAFYVLFLAENRCILPNYEEKGHIQLSCC